MRAVQLLGLLLTALVGGLLATSTASCQSAARFDSNGDGVLDTMEMGTYLLHMEQTSFNLNNLVNSPERDSTMAAILAKLESEYGRRSTYSFAQVDRLFALASRTSKTKPFGILIRDSYEEITIADDAKGFAKAKPGMLAFDRDILANTNTFSVQASLMYPIRTDRPGPAECGTCSYISTVGFIPSVTMNRVTNANPSKEVNLLQFRIGADVEVFQGFINLQNFRAFAALATDFDFKSKVLAGEIGWLPTQLNLGMGMYNELLCSSVEYRWRVYPYMEWGYVLRAGDKENLTAKDAFGRLGGKVSFDLALFGPNQIVLGGSGRYLRGVLQGPKDLRMYELTGSYGFGIAGHASLEAKYSKGDMPLTLEAIDVLSVGIGIKF